MTRSSEICSRDHSQTESGKINGMERFIPVTVDKRYRNGEIHVFDRRARKSGETV